MSFVRLWKGIIQEKRIKDIIDVLRNIKYIWEQLAENFGK